MTGTFLVPWVVSSDFSDDGQEPEMRGPCIRHHELHG